MNYLITGGTGFIGSYIIRQLLDQGHNVVCFDYAPNNTSIQQVLTEKEISRIKIVQGDVADMVPLMQVCKEHKIENIIHEAGALGDVVENNPGLAVRTNILGTINVFEAARIFNVKRVVWASSQSCFGPPEKYAEEYVPNDAVLYPTYMYGATKSFLEFLGDFYFKKFGLDNIGLRYTMVYGVARMRGNGQFATELIVKPANGEKGVVDFGDDSPNWIYVEDAARATILASQVDTTETRVFTIQGEVKSIKDIREYILKLLPDAEIELLSGRFPSCWKFETTPAEKELGYKYEYSAEEGVRKTINLIRAAKGLPTV